MIQHLDPNLDVKEKISSLSMYFVSYGGAAGAEKSKFSHQNKSSIFWLLASVTNID